MEWSVGNNILIAIDLSHYVELDNIALLQLQFGHYNRTSLAIDRSLIEGGYDALQFLKQMVVNEESAMQISRDMKAIMIALVVGTIILALFFLLHVAITPERDVSTSEEIVVEEGLPGGDGGGMGGEGGGEPASLKKPTAVVERRANVLDALQGGKASNSMRDHLKKIRESTK